MCVYVYIFWLINHLKISYRYHDTKSSACITKKQGHSPISSYTIITPEKVSNNALIADAQFTVRIFPIALQMSFRAVFLKPDSYHGRSIAFGCYFS